MADFAKRPEVTVNTMGRVQNPTGEGVRAVSTQVQAKSAKLKQQATSSSSTDDSTASSSKKNDTSKEKDKESSSNGRDSSNKDDAKGGKDSHETKVKEGTAKRNITRKKTDGKDSGNYDSRNKKQGGHGKGQWKEFDVVLRDEDLPALDEKDPLYDDHQKAYILSSGVEQDRAARAIDPICQAKIYGPILTLSEYKIQVAATLKEYFDSCDADEVIRSLEELKCQEYHPEVVKKAVSLSLDQSPRERELVSRLLTCLHPSPLSHADMEAGFKLLLDSLDDLSTDVPEAKNMVASFLARAVVDEVVPPAFLSEQNNERPGDAVIEKAVSLLSREHCTARLERVWGPGDGRPVAEVKQEMDQLLQEYLLSRELDEAARCVRELNVAHFHHELVKRGVVIAMEQPAASEALDAMAALFTFLVNNAILSEYQVLKGMSRLQTLLPDLTLDVPAAADLLREFDGFMAQENGGCLPGKSAGRGSGGRPLETAVPNGDEDTQVAVPEETTTTPNDTPNGEELHPPTSKDDS